MQVAKAKAEAEEEVLSETVQVGSKAKKKKGVDENEIRNQTTKGLRQEMDKQVARREYRFQDAAMRKDTTTQWDLVAAAVEEANINCYGPIGKDATNMKKENPRSHSRNL